MEERVAYKRPKAFDHPEKQVFIRGAGFKKSEKPELM
jgi:hypothetical protein